MADTRKTPSDLEGRIAELEAEIAASDEAIAALSQRQSDVEDEFDRLVHKLRGQIDLRDDG